MMTEQKNNNTNKINVNGAVHTRKLRFISQFSIQKHINTKENVCFKAWVETTSPKMMIVSV